MKKAPGNRAGKERVAAFFTGGTIAMKMEKDPAGVLPEDLFHQIMEDLKPLLEDGRAEPIYWSDVPSPHMTPELMFRLAKEVQKRLEEETICGAVVIHGTDVMEESAFMMDLVLRGSKPVVFTGAMRSFNEPGYDGIRNLLYSFRVCRMPESRAMGVMVLMTDRIFSAREVTKVNSLHVDAFEAPGLGPLGLVKGHGIHFIRKPNPRLEIPGERIEPRVDLIKLCTGMDDRFIRCSLEHGTRGLVLEGFGSGNVPPGIVPAIEEAIDHGIPVVITTRCVQGGVWPLYGYPGGGLCLKQKGIILGGGLSGQKARILLMVLLGSTDNLAEVKETFEKWP